MTGPHDDKGQSRAEAAPTRMARLSPLGRISGSKDVARTVLHLASDGAAFTTDRILCPNGDAVMPWGRPPAK
ncbi:hypothetical protein GCM10027162_20620 [Streptomyces incanus]